MAAERDFLVVLCETVERQYWVEANTPEEARAKITDDPNAGTPLGEGCVVEWEVLSVKGNFTNADFANTEEKY
jgi:hypothetical protein